MKTLSPVELDLMYNNRLMVPEHAQFFGRWSQASQAVRQRLRCTLDVSYGAAPSETLDIFPAKQKNQAPVLVFIHGGYWRSMDKSDHSFIAPSFVEAGYCVVVVNYALCPTVRIPEICLQLTHAVSWVSKHIHNWGGDAKQLHVHGHSAGGHLVAMLMACQWSQVDPHLPAQVLASGLSISGLHELETIRRVPFLRDALRLTPSDALRCSPAWMPAPRSGRCVCAVGGLESAEFIRQNQLLAQQWGQSRVPQTVTLPGLNHFSVLDSYAQPQGDLHRLALATMAAA